MGPHNMIYIGMSLSGLPAAAKDQIDQIRFRIYEDYFGAVAATGQTQPSARMQRTHLYTIGAEIGSNIPHMTLADFEKGVDPRGVLYANGLTTQGPHYAWAPAQTDNINFWDVISDNDGQNDFADYHLVLVPQSWQPYTQLRIKFYTTCTTSCDGKITPIIHDTDGGYTSLGTFSASQRDAQNWITIPLTGVLNRDQIDDLTLRVHESYFGGTTINGASQRTHVYDIELQNNSFYQHPLVQNDGIEYTAFSRPNNYDYAPSIMKDGNIYKMWWCTSEVTVIPNNTDTVWDVIRYAESTDGINWTINSNIVLQVMNDSPETNGAKRGHACDPSVVKVNGIYYMYYDAAGPTQEQCDKTAIQNLCPLGYIQYNQIYLATSTNGVNWTKRLNPTTGKPQPIIANTYLPPTLYGIGQPTALYVNGRFYLYYTDSANWQSTRLKISHNGIFDDSDVGYQVYSDMDLVPTYHKDYGTFIAMSAHDLSVAAGYPLINPLFFHFSYNGVRWTNDYQSFATVVVVNPSQGANVIHNPGILTDPHGLTSGNTLKVYYGGGPDLLTDWEIKYTNLTLQ